MYILAELEPSAELTGGSWYTGALPRPCPAQLCVYLFAHARAKSAPRPQTFAGAGGPAHPSLPLPQPWPSPAPAPSACTAPHARPPPPGERRGAGRGWAGGSFRAFGGVGTLTYLPRPCALGESLMAGRDVGVGSPAAWRQGGELDVDLVEACSVRDERYRTIFHPAACVMKDTELSFILQRA